MAQTNHARRRARHGHGQLVAESTATADTVDVGQHLQGEAVHEAGGTMEAPKAGTRDIPIVLIKAGVSLNGRAYPAEVLKRDGAATFPRGTLSFADHDSDREAEDYPAGSIRKAVGYLTGDAVWDESLQALTGTLRPFAHWDAAVRAWAESGVVDMSIRTWTDTEPGIYEGRKMPVVQRMYNNGGMSSVDIVTHGAAGGRLGVLESVQATVAEARTIGAWAESRIHLAFTAMADDMYGRGNLTRQERIALSSAIGDGLAAFVTRVEADAPQLYERDIWDDPTAATVHAEEGRPVAEASSEEVRRALTAALREAYATGRTPAYIWLRDYDAERSVCWYEQSARDGECTTYQQGYSVAESGRITLAAERTAVVARTVYDPAPSGGSAATVHSGENTAVTTTTPQSSTGITPVAEQVQPADGQAAPPNPQKEESMTAPQTGPASGTGGAGEPARTPTPPQYTEAMHQSHEALLAKEAEAKREREAREAAEKENREHRAKDAARSKVAEKLATSSLAKVGVAHQRIIESVVATKETWSNEDGTADAARLDNAIDATITREATYLAQAAEQLYGVGKVRGLGTSGEVGESVESLTKANDQIMADIAALTGTAKKGA